MCSANTGSEVSMQDQPAGISSVRSSARNGSFITALSVIENDRFAGRPDSDTALMWSADRIKVNAEKVHSMVRSSFVFQGEHGVIALRKTI